MPERKPLELVVHPRNEHGDYLTGGWNIPPWQIREKRLTDAELAAEHWKAAERVRSCAHPALHVQRANAVAKLETLHRFATHPALRREVQPMTTIKSLLGAATLDVTVKPNAVVLKMSRGEDDAFGAFEPAELLAALNAVDANKVLQDASDALDKRRGLEARAEAAEAKLANANKRLVESERVREAAEAERDAHTATIERVRALVADMRSKGNKTVPSLIDAALDPKPFVLPTEVPARLRAELAEEGDGE